MQRSTCLLLGVMRWLPEIRRQVASRWGCPTAQTPQRVVLSVGTWLANDGPGGEFGYGAGLQGSGRAVHQPAPASPRWGAPACSPPLLRT